MSPHGAITDLRGSGVSIWLDDLSRSLLDSGELAGLIEDLGVSGVTTNPSIFAAAVRGSDDYRDYIAQLVRLGMAAGEAVFEIMIRDVTQACDVLMATYRATDGSDGRVSIEVAPTLAHDAAATLEQATALWRRIDRPNLLIKIPATREGFEAIEGATALGISVNATLIFSLDQYRKTAAAYLAGLERAQAAGLDLGSIRSVASVFVSRWDTAVDARLSELGRLDSALRATAGQANARLAYGAFQEIFATEQATDLLAAGAHPQRPLWASTGVKDPSLPDTRYVTELVAPDTVNTMPRATLTAVADHGVVEPNSVIGRMDEAREQWQALTEAGVDLDAVAARLEAEGVAAFVAAWDKLIEAVGSALGA